MKRKNVIPGLSEAAFNFFPMRIAVFDSDQASSQEYIAFLQKFPHKYEVSNKTYQDFTWLETDGSEFDIILIGECLAAHKMKLLQIGNARGMTVLVTSADGGIETIMRTMDDGDCVCLPKPIPESVLELVWAFAYKRKYKLAQMQKLTDDASREKKPRLKWTGDLKKKAEESVSEAGGIKGAKANDILQRLRAKGIQDRSITTEKVNSYLQKERERADKNKEGTIEGSTLKTESNHSTGGQPSVDGFILEDSSLPLDKSFPEDDQDDDQGDDHSKDDQDDDHTNPLLDGGVLAKMMLSETIPSHMPVYKDKEGTRSEHVESTNEMEEHPNQQGFNSPLPVEANTSGTIGGQPSVDKLFNDFCNALPSLDGVNLKDYSAPSNKSFPTGMSENYTAEDDIARDHSNGLLGSDVLTMEKISEMIPSNMPGYKDKEGTSSQHVESRYEMEEHPPMTLPHPNTTNPNQQGLNLPLPVAGNTSCTSGGLPFINDFPDNFFEGLGSESSDFGGIFEGPSSSLPNERCPVEITKNYTGNDIAHEYSDNL